MQVQPQSGENKQKDEGYLISTLSKLVSQDTFDAFVAVKASMDEFFKDISTPALLRGIYSIFRNQAAEKDLARKIFHTTPFYDDLDLPPTSVFRDLYSAPELTPLYGDTVLTLSRIVRHTTAVYGWAFVSGTLAKALDRRFVSPLKMSSFVSSAKTKIGENTKALCLHTGIENKDIIFTDWFSSTTLPAHYIVHDRNLKSLVLSIRGTFNIADVITDALCHSVEFHCFGVKGYVHAGMFKSAKRIISLNLARIDKELEDLYGIPPPPQTFGPYYVENEMKDKTDNNVDALNDTDTPIIPSPTLENKTSSSEDCSVDSVDSCEEIEAECSKTFLGYDMTEFPPVLKDCSFPSLLTPRMPTVRILLTGHSLGGSTAVLATLLLAHIRPQWVKLGILRCDAIAPPPFISANFAQLPLCSSIVRAFIQDDDFASRLSIRSIFHLKKQMFDAKEWKTKQKTDDKKTNMDSIELLDITDIDFEKIREIKTLKTPDINGETFDKDALFPVGVIFFIDPVVRLKDWVIRAPVSPFAFDRLCFSPHMFMDHMSHRYEQAIDAIAEKLSGNSVGLHECIEKDTE